MLRAVPRTNDRRWTAFIESHLRQLNALPRASSDDDFDRRVQWSRFVRKFILLGHTFAAKRIGLGKLVERYLVVAGSDDGIVRAVSFAAGDPASSWQVKPWDRVPDAVNSVALIRNVDKPLVRFSCYLGTAGGDTYALAILSAREDSRLEASQGVSC